MLDSTAPYACCCPRVLFRTVCFPTDMPLSLSPPNVDPTRELSLRQRLATLIRARLEMLIPFKQVWPEALALLVQPSVLSDSLEEAALLVDSLCYLSADQSADLSWYAKRLGLLGVYSSTELYLLTDTTPAHQSTWEFLDRRLEDLSAVHSALERAALSLPLLRALPSLGSGLVHSAVQRAPTESATVATTVSEAGHPTQVRTTVSSARFGAFGGDSQSSKQASSSF
jgi:rpsU-divergently transcribed protein